MALRYFLLLSVILFLFGCSDKPEKPDNLIPEESYTELLVELQLVRSYSKKMQSDSITVDSLTTDVFEKYDVNSEQFQQSHLYYQQFPKKQLQRIDRAIENLKKDQVSDTTMAADSLGPNDSLIVCYREIQGKDFENASRYIRFMTKSPNQKLRGLYHRYPFGNYFEEQIPLLIYRNERCNHIEHLYLHWLFCTNCY